MDSQKDVWLAVHLDILLVAWLDVYSGNEKVASMAVLWVDLMADWTVACKCN